ncbi:MAG: hypothetical protein ACLR0U_13410 [Enterocloster clostridioformis]
MLMAFSLWTAVLEGRRPRTAGTCIKLATLLLPMAIPVASVATLLWKLLLYPSGAPLTSWRYGQAGGNRTG